ncbi:hypothetical protein [Leptolyngbya sp. Cla-17]|uniref:hypothetical protein n=1 Tax=Leptolyngbya sp. Cla-17 TaxID=2803751 RepID=UPI001F5CA15B|nr:hypothetical protein [Leptolyngbya sp. Cla-17]
MHRIQARLASLLSKSELKQPTISSYGQAESGVALDDIQPVMEWLFLSLLNAGYQGQSHLFWLSPRDAVDLHQHLRQLHQKDEPIFGYRCGDRVSTPRKAFIGE